MHNTCYIKICFGWFGTLSGDWIDTFKKINTVQNNPASERKLAVNNLKWYKYLEKAHVKKGFVKE